MPENWQDQRWKYHHYVVRKLQRRIAKATVEGDWKKVANLQDLLVRSYSARLLAVRQVTAKAPRRTPGIDGVFWNDEENRFVHVAQLRMRRYRPHPLLRVYVPKSNDPGRLRKLSIPVISDRAVQALYLLALDPVVETMSDPHSFAFRKFRNANDAMRCITEDAGLMEHRPWVLKADVFECFDHVSHAWMLNHVHMNRRVLGAMLRAEYQYQGERHKITEGTPQGGVISPCLVNCVLNGIERELIAKYGVDDVFVVRFADDFVISTSSPAVAAAAREDLVVFLRDRGLCLSETKTRVVHVSEGFDFVGWHVVSNGSKLVLDPSQDSIDRALRRIEALIFQGRRWRQKRLIEELNLAVKGWTCYHRYLCREEVFLYLDSALLTGIRCWARRRHPDWEWDRVLLRYWHDGVFCSPGATLILYSSVVVRVRGRLDCSQNPYIDPDYFRRRGREVPSR